MNFAKINKSDMLVLNLTAESTNPDLNLFLEVETDFIFNLSIYDYRFNQADSTFYNVGPKVKVIDPDTPTIKTSAFPDAEGRRARLKGTHSEACPSGETTVIEYTVPDEDGGRWIDACEYEAEGRNPGDLIHFKILMGPHTEPYAVDWHVFGGRVHYQLYPAWLNVGDIIRVEYVNQGPNAVQFDMNSFLHMDDSQE